MVSIQPLRLSRGSHQSGSGKGCAMNVISWENGDAKITDYPACSDRMLSKIVQGVNDSLADSDGYLNAENSLKVLDLGHATVGTSSHGLNDIELKQVYVKCAVFAARKVAYLNTNPRVMAAILAAEAWANDPNEENKKAAVAAAAAADAAYAAAAAAYAAADAADAAYAAAAADAAAAAYAAADAADAADVVAAADAADAAYAAAAAAAAYAADVAAAAAADAAYAAADAADAAADAAYAADAAGKNQFKIDLTWEIIALFKSLTNVAEQKFDEGVFEDAYEKMLVTA